jgi:hypothetical protein
VRVQEAKELHDKPKLGKIVFLQHSTMSRVPLLIRHAFVAIAGCYFLYKVARKDYICLLNLVESAVIRQEPLNHVI